MNDRYFFKGKSLKDAMTDRYLFRGKSLENGKWVKGYYELRMLSEPIIHNLCGFADSYHEIDIETPRPMHGTYGQKQQANL